MQSDSLLDCAQYLPQHQLIQGFGLSFAVVVSNAKVFPSFRQPNPGQLLEAWLEPGGQPSSPWEAH